MWDKVGVASLRRVEPLWGQLYDQCEALGCPASALHKAYVYYTRAESQQFVDDYLGLCRGTIKFSPKLLHRYYNKPELGQALIKAVLMKRINS